jgi:uncharacterized membrane protein YphA (DoxX/SURF4 family)
MDVLRTTSNRLESGLNQIAAPLKPHLAHIGRFLLIVTFLEDALRIYMQWGDQLRFLQIYRRFPSFLSKLFLTYNIVAMLGGSAMAVTRTKTVAACALLLSVVVLQSFGYGLVSNFSFMARNVSLVGGILLLLVEGKAKQAVFAGLPMISPVEKGTYISLLGRVLLICLFGSLTVSGDRSTPIKTAFLLLSCLSSVMVAVGFKARYSAIFLVAILSLFNVVAHQWWNLHPESAERDFLRYDFFQTLSIIGGFLLLVDAGPGELSIDEKKKTF